jgi:hypothetical protein
MLVAAVDKRRWYGHVRYNTLFTPFQQRIIEFALKTPGMGRLLPWRGDGNYYEPTWHTATWHTATNAPMASSTVTNTP